MRGRALIHYLEDSGVFNERMELRFDPSGMVTVVAGTHSHGQGHATTYAQLVSDWLGVPFENVRLVQGDTDAVSFGRGTYASRSAMLGGSALRAAADGIIEKAKPLAAHLHLPHNSTAARPQDFAAPLWHCSPQRADNSTGWLY